MIKERFRLMYMPSHGADIKQIGLDTKKFWFFSSLFLTTLVLIIVLVIGSFTRLFHNYRIVSLKNDRENLRQELLAIKGQVHDLNTLLASVEETGDELRTVANLPEIDDDTRQVGVGGGSFEFGYFPDDISRSSAEIKLDLDKIQRAVSLEKNSLGELSTVLSQKQEQRKYWPSIKPIVGGTIDDQFGFRSHPLTGRIQDHKGIDMPHRKGTPVLATADGWVKEVRNNYRLNKSYGRYIVIDHGNGYQTLYAHLSKAGVRVGEKVKRWQVIGEVGMSGGTTGYHLHYEVRQGNKPVDPEYYIYN